MPEILITGAHGFIASAVQKHLSKFPEFHVHMASVRGDGWRSMDFSRYDAILHTAGIAHVNPDPSLAEQYRSVNFVLTQELAEKARREGVGQFIFLSSILVFGDSSRAGERKMITPNTVPAPVNAYGQSKLDAENALNALADEHFRVVILRLPMVYGPGCRGGYNVLSKMARLLPFFPKVDNRRSFIYIENLAELIRMILSDRASGMFHPRDSHLLSVSQIVQEIGLAHGKKIHLCPLLGAVVRLIGNHSLIRKAFGDKAYSDDMPDYPADYRRVSFEEAIRRTEEGKSR